MPITTVKDYCTKRGISRQFVYEYVRKGKFKLLELPAFIEVEGVRIEIGKQKFLSIPDEYNIEKKIYWSGELSDEAYSRALATDATQDAEIQHVMAHFLALRNKADKTAYKSHLFEALYPETHPKRTILDEAFKKCLHLMTAEAAYIQEQVRDLKA